MIFDEITEAVRKEAGAKKPGKFRMKLSKAGKKLSSVVGAAVKGAKDAAKGGEPWPSPMAADIEDVVEEIRFVLEGGGSRASKAARQQASREKRWSKGDVSTFGQISRAGSSDTKRLWVSRDREKQREGSSTSPHSTIWKRSTAKRGQKLDRQKTIDKIHRDKVSKEAGASDFNLKKYKLTPAGRRSAQLKQKYMDRKS